MVLPLKVSSIHSTTFLALCTLLIMKRSELGKKYERAKKMISLGYMREPGLKLIEAAKSNGKWVE